MTSQSGDVLGFACYGEGILFILFFYFFILYIYLVLFTFLWEKIISSIWSLDFSVGVQGGKHIPHTTSILISRDSRLGRALDHNAPGSPVKGLMHFIASNGTVSFT